MSELPAKQEQQSIQYFCHCLCRPFLLHCILKRTVTCQIAPIGSYKPMAIAFTEMTNALGQDKIFVIQLLRGFYGS
jgi:hypothetical protein